MEWTGDEVFEQKLYEALIHPLKFPEQYKRNESLFPVRRLVSIWSRPDQGAANAVAHHLEKHDIKKLIIIPVNFGHTSFFIEQIKTVPLDHVVILEHADVLAFEPDDEATMKFCLQLAELNLTIVACFERLPKTGDQQTEYQRRFFYQFRASAYLSAPNDEFRQRYFQFLFERLSDVADVKLEEKDYMVLSMASTFATPNDMKEFVKRIYYEYTAKEEKQRLLDINVLLSRFLTTNPYGHRCIFRIDYRFDENEFSQACGAGPIPGMPEKPDMREVHRTGFSKDLVDMKQAAKELGLDIEHNEEQKRAREVQEAWEVVHGKEEEGEKEEKRQKTEGTLLEIPDEQQQGTVLFEEKE
jgi:hypothetical protein